MIVCLVLAGTSLRCRWHATLTEWGANLCMRWGWGFLVLASIMPERLSVAEVTRASSLCGTRYISCGAGARGIMLGSGSKPVGLCVLVVSSCRQLGVGGSGMLLVGR